MKRRRRISQRRTKRYAKPIKYFADRQINWLKYVVELRSIKVIPATSLTIPGDAPKDFVSDREYRQGHRSRRRPFVQYIAKVGSKFYPLESIVEDYLTRVGECLGVNIAGSKLRIIEGQVRFMSKYFRTGSDTLTHGAELYESCLGKDNYQALADRKEEKTFFTFEDTTEAISTAFPDFADSIIKGYVEMIVFDAIVGHNDRHPYNWGVIVPTKKARKPRFSPVYDTAHALFWNNSEEKVVRMLNDPKLLENYALKSQPAICWDREKVDFFELIGLIWERYPSYRDNIERFLDVQKLENAIEVLHTQYEELLSLERRELMEQCLRLRLKLTRDSITSRGGVL
jgi:hypothetical protein